MLLPNKRLLQAHRSELQGLNDGCANCSHPSMMILMIFKLEAHASAP